MVSGPYSCRGKVVKVTPEGVEVEPDSSEMRLKFDKDGKECTFDKQEFPNAWMGTYEGGPWELVAQI